MKRMTIEQRKRMDCILDEARKEGALVNYNNAAGPFMQLLTAVIALEASYEDPVGIAEEDIPEVQTMVLRLLEIYTGESLGEMENFKENEN